MNRLMNWLRSFKLRQVFAVALMAIAFVLAPNFGMMRTLGAQADVAGRQTTTADQQTAEPRIIQADRIDLDKNVIKRIQDQAEDVGEKDRDIGETGLKNLRKLRENIPETLDLVKRQRIDGEIDVPPQAR